MTIITTVGTSLFTNYGNNLGKEFENIEYWKNIERYEKRLKPTLDKLKEFIDKKKYKSCAELTTIKKLKEKYENIEVYLIATDTIRSYLASKAIKYYLENEEIKINFEKSEQHIIKYLNVFINDRDIIKKGSKNLIKVLIDNTSGYGEIFNISGGYKAIIPIMTQIASYKKINLAYIYEDSDYLLEIPPFPFEIDKNIINNLKEIFEKIDKETAIQKNEFKQLIKKLPLEKSNLIEYLFEDIDEKNITTSTIGDILLEDYLTQKDIELVECKEKDFNIDNGRHHDKEKVRKFGEKLLKNEYVCKILGSAEYEPHKNDLVIEIEPQKQTGVLKLKVPNTDKATILVKTSGRNFKETQKIAQILENQFTKG